MKNEDIQKVAKLAHLDLKDDEAKALMGNLNDILGYIENLNELDLDGIEPTAHAVEIDNVFRESSKSVDRSDVVKHTLKGAPDHDDEFFLVPKVINK